MIIASTCQEDLRRNFEKINKIFSCIYLYMRVEEGKDAFVRDNCINRQSNLCLNACADRNLLAVTLADILFLGKSKGEIGEIVNLLHILIALSKTYMQ